MVFYDIVMATYNGEKFLKEQLESIIYAINFSKSGQIRHLIISDDGSKDKTVSIIKEYVNMYSFINFCENRSLNGVKENFQNGLKESTSDYVFFADQDDIWHKDKIEISLLELIKLENGQKEIPTLVLSNINLVDEHLLFLSSGHDFLPEDVTDPTMTVYRSFGQGCTMAFNRSLIAKAAPIPNRCVMHDWWILLVASNFGKVKYITTPLMDYRQHSNNVCGGTKNNNLKRFINLKNQINYIKKVSMQSQVFIDRFEQEINNANSLESHLFLSNLKNKGILEKIIFYNSKALNIRGIKNSFKFLIQIVFNG